MNAVRRLLDHVASDQPHNEQDWQDWHITPIPGGRNNLLYRATSPRSDLALKFTIRDGRDRAGREYGALSTLRQAGLAVAPEPILLDHTSYVQPVVVQEWLEGEVSAAPPATMAEWQSLVQHLATVHTVTPDRSGMKLRYATIHASDSGEAKERVRQQVERLPATACPSGLEALLRRFEDARLADWPPAPVTLTRLDNNVTNYVRRPGPWASVDWEYSGWGDPAFDVANLLTHVAYMAVPASRWPEIVDAYCDLVADATASLRIGTYCQILLVWWVVRLARYMYELPRGLDERLADWPPGWQADIETKYEHFLSLAQHSYA